MGPRQRLATSLVSVAVVVALGTLSLMVVEGWPAFDALYMVVTTVTTVGYGEIRPLSTAGRALMIVLILVGAGTVLYSLTSLVEVLITERIAPEKVRRRA